MILLGSEVKSLREKKLNLKDSFVSIKDEKVWLIGAHISSYSHTGFSGHSPTRNRELLLHKKEMTRLKNIVAQKGLTIVPLKAYFKGGIAKIEFATAKGKKTYQKKEALKMRDLDREARREMSKK
jgi:SsrA-binding protein